MRAGGQISSQAHGLAGPERVVQNDIAATLLVLGQGVGRLAVYRHPQIASKWATIDRQVKASSFKGNGQSTRLVAGNVGLSLGEAPAGAVVTGGMVGGVMPGGSQRRVGCDRLEGGQDGRGFLQGEAAGRVVGS